jgi:hypothetical protein
LAGVDPLDWLEGFGPGTSISMIGEYSLRGDGGLQYDASNFIQHSPRKSKSMGISLGSYHSSPLHVGYLLLKIKKKTQWIESL